MGWTAAGLAVLVLLPVLLLAVLLRGRGPRGPATRRRHTSARRSVVRAATALNSAVEGSTAIPVPWAAVSVKPGRLACEAALTLRNHRFLQSDAPPLPLEEGQCAHCECTFEHHVDRRRDMDGDRRFESDQPGNLYGTAGEPERRLRPGRRATDFN